MIEDRVVLFQATDFDDAIKQAIKDARFYCKRNRYVNIYGQEVLLRFLDVYDAYEILEVPDRDPGAGSEVYSSTELVGAAV